MMSRTLLALCVVGMVLGARAAAGGLRASGAGDVFTVKLQHRPGARAERFRRLASVRLSQEHVRRLQDGSTAVATETVNGTWTVLSSAYKVPQYTFPVAAGTPPRTFYIIPDSGSNYVGLASGVDQPNFFNDNQYNTSASTTYRSDPKVPLVDLQYGGGGLMGPGAFDNFMVGSLVAKQQGFILVHHVSGTSFIGDSVYWEGIWGLCFQGLYRNASAPFSGPAFFKPMLQTLFEQQQLATPSFGFYLDNAIDSDDAGEITFGGPNPERYTGDLHYVDILPMHTSRTVVSDQFGYWLHAVDNVTIDGRVVPACAENSCYGFVDTGGPLLNVPLSVAAAIVPYVHVNANCSGIENNPTLSLVINGKPFPLTPDDYVYKVLDPLSGELTCELGINVLPGASNYLFQIGDTFLRKYYAYFEAGSAAGFAVNPRIGYATAVHQ